MGVRREVLAEACVLAFFALAACVYTYPMAARLDMAFLPPGFREGDDLTHFWWTFWWVKKSALEMHASPYFSGYIFFPAGASLAFHTVSMLNSASSVPLQGLLGLPATYNLLYLASLVFAAYGGYRLVYYLTGDRMASVVSGVIFSFNMQHWNTVGQINLANYGGLAFFCMYYIRMFREDRWVYVWPAAFFMALCTWSAWAMMVFVLLFMGVFFAWLAVTGGLAGLSRFGVKTAALLCLFVVLVSPEAYVLVRATLGEAGSLYSIPSGLIRLQRMTGFVFPAGGGGYFFGWTAIFGLTATALAALSLAHWRRPEVALWLMAFGVFFVLSLGPYWVSRDGVVDEGIRLPFWYLGKLPVLKGVRHPYRYWTMDMLALSVLAGYSLAWAGGRLRAFGDGAAVYRAAAASLAVFALAEASAIPRMAYSAGVPGVYYEIAREPGDFAVLEVPFMGGIEGSYMYYQTVHGKRIMGGHISRIPPGSLDFAKSNGFTRYLIELGRKRGKADAEGVTRGDIDSLAAAGVRYVLVHRGKLYGARATDFIRQDPRDKVLPPGFNRAYRNYYEAANMERQTDTFESREDLDAFVARMDGWFGPPVKTGGDVLVYRTK